MGVALEISELSAEEFCDSVDQNANVVNEVDMGAAMVTIVERPTGDKVIAISTFEGRYLQILIK